MALHAATIFLSAFLLFLVQPILAKQILPWFGGAAIVWTTCMVFFQFVLLLGYAYAHGLTRLKPPLQAAIHVALLAASLLFLPITPDPSWKPAGGDNPVARILALLFATIGLPYFLLSATSPLVQAWFARAAPGRNPYPLFALSNFASMSALLGYPFLLEPVFRNAEQSLYWSIGFGGFALLCGALAIRSRALPELPELPAHASPAAALEPPPRAPQVALWLLLSAMGSVMLLAVSNHLTQNISSIPLLWVVPLAIYLLTFILCFEGRAWYRRDAYLGLLLWVLCVMAWFLADKSLQFDLLWHILVFGIGLFVVCMFCHGELARRRPAPRHLTLFYLMVSLGGVLGGILVGIAAPIALPGYLELEIALIVVAAIALATNLRRPLPIVGMFVAVLAVTVGAFAYRVHTFRENTVYIERNYYGVLRVKESRSRLDDEETTYRSLVHGAILHGEQWQSEKYRRSATTYYKVTSGIGRALLAHEGKPIRVGIIGLGAGSIAVYGDADDVYRFYDIDAAVVRVANTYFTYLKDSAAKIEIAVGDARISLEREAPQGFDVLAVDAFSGDSIPVHLLTYEAVGEYLRHLKPDGVIAFHVSNRFLDLKPVILAIAERHGLEFAYIHETGEEGGTTSDWVLVSRNKALIYGKGIAEAIEPVAPRPDWNLWTDDFNNLVQVFKY